MFSSVLAGNDNSFVEAMFWPVTGRCSHRRPVPADLAGAAAADHLRIHVERCCVFCNESVGGRTLPAAAAVTHLAPGGFAGDTLMVV